MKIMQRKEISKFMSVFFANNPLVCVDVGAAGGPKNPWESSSYMTWVGVEPQEGEVPLVLGSQEGEGLLYVTHNPDSSSLLEPNQRLLSQFGVWERYKVEGKLPVKVLPLDSWVKNENIPLVDFLKIDTQGTELSVLLGSQKTLESVLGVDVEVNFSERYKGQSYFADIDIFLRREGFVLFDLQRRYFKRISGLSLGLPKGQLTHGTALYLRSTESFSSTVVNIKDRELQSLAVLRFASVALMYGYADYAKYIVDNLSGLLTKDHSVQFLKLLGGCVQRSSVDFKGRYRLYSLAKKLFIFLKPISKKGNTGDEELGNF